MITKHSVKTTRNNDGLILSTQEFSTYEYHDRSITTYTKNINGEVLDVCYRLQHNANSTVLTCEYRVLNQYRVMITKTRINKKAIYSVTVKKGFNITKQDGFTTLTQVMTYLVGKLVLYTTFADIRGL